MRTLMTWYAPQTLRYAGKLRLLLLYWIFAIFLARIPIHADPIHEAAKKGDLDSIKKLLADGVNIDIKDEHGGTPLVWATIRSQQPTVEFLLANGAKVDAATGDNVTALHYAVKYGETNIARVLVKNGAKTSLKTSHGDTPLKLAAQGGFLEIVELLVEGGADLDVSDNVGITPLHYAAAMGYTRIVDYLISKGANCDVVSKSTQPPRTALLSAAWNHHEDIVKMLLKHGAKDNWLSGVPGFDPENVSPLQLSMGSDGRVMSGSLPFFLGRHSAVRPWKDPGTNQPSRTGNDLFRWATLPNGDKTVTLIVIENEKRNTTMANALLPAFIGTGGVIYTDGVSAIAQDGPFAEIEITWKRGANNLPVTSGHIVVTRKDATVELAPDKDGLSKHLLKHVTPNEPITITFKPEDGKQEEQVDLDCVIRGATENSVFLKMMKSD